MLKSELRETKCDNSVKRIPSPHLKDPKECESGRTATLHNGSQLPHPYNDKTLTSQPWMEQAGVTVLSQFGIRRKKKTVWNRESVKLQSYISFNFSSMIISGQVTN